MTVRTSIDIDPELEKELSHAQGVTREKRARVIRLALRLGLPVVLNRFQAPRPEGYFEDAYGANGERQALEKAMGKSRQVPERR